MREIGEHLCGGCWVMIDDKVTPCARGAYKVGKRPMRHKVANKSALLLWFTQRPLDWLLEALALMCCFLSKAVGLRRRIYRLTSRSTFYACGIKWVAHDTQIYMV
jgi:hypothetical protein